MSDQFEESDEETSQKRFRRLLSSEGEGPEGEKLPSEQGKTDEPTTSNEGEGGEAVSSRREEDNTTDFDEEGSPIQETPAEQTLPADEPAQESKTVLQSEGIKEEESKAGEQQGETEEETPPADQPIDEPSREPASPGDYVSLQTLFETSVLPTGEEATQVQPAPSPSETQPESTLPVKPGEGEITPPAARHGLPTPPPPSGWTPRSKPPAIGTQAMPLPRRVDEVDMEATHVTPAAYAPVTRPRRVSAPPRKLPPVRRPAPKPRTRPSIQWRVGLGLLLRMLIIGIFGLIVVFIGAASIILYEYYSIASTLPSIDDLHQKASQFETSRILDRNGNVLYEIFDPNAGRRTYVKLDQVSAYMIAATIATEDKEFYNHPGFDPVAILRAFWQNYQSRDTVSGASTITQQLSRTLFFTPEERSERTYMRKVREALLALEVTRQYSKDEILELYLNEIFYGYWAYGVEAAAETYFGTTADKLTLGQAAFLAGLPQAPSVYDVYTNREDTLARQEQVLRLMYEASLEQGCIAVRTQPEKVCVDVQNALSAYQEIQSYQFKTPEVRIRYPHWVNYVHSILKDQYDPQTIYRSGFTVYTTIDPGLQDAAEQIVSKQVGNLQDRHVTDGALVAIRPKTGEILAMVGSADFYNETIAGQVNMAISPRQPGSSIKPLTYLAAFEKGWTPSTLIWDVPSEFPPSGVQGDPRPPYIPKNYDDRFHGPQTVRYALANSYNVPAVKTLQFVGIYDNPNAPGEDGLVAMAKRLGITTLTADYYGLALTLGGGEVSLLELSGAYAAFANGGLRVPPYAITKITDSSGNVVFEHQQPPPQQVMRVEHAYLISSILSDNEARSSAFGPNSVLNLPFSVAVKTGTSDDFRDNWTLGFTSDLVVGAWVGNADNTPMAQNTSGVTGAGPIWAEFMQLAIQQITGGNPTPFFRPAGVVDRVICAVSGTEPSQWCPKQRTELFAADQPPLPREQDLWSKVLIDSWTGLRASPACPNFTQEAFALNVTDPWAVKWIQENSAGQAWAAEMGFSQPVQFVSQRECGPDDPRPILEITSPGEGVTVSVNPLDIYGRADATGDFRLFRLDYGLGHDPLEWVRLVRSEEPIKQNDKIFSWDVQDIPAGPVTLRLRVVSNRDTSAEIFVHIILQVPTRTPTPTQTPTATPTITNTPPPSLTPTITSTPTQMAEPSATPTPTQTTTEESTGP
jgi:penicillin-binding protein 1C